uniref:ATPase AAA-type core domain-containing protein n=1 Tax=Ditylenchus dipsaci TaxID=166011 RepID=A0A915CQS8_9BILA
MRVDSRELRVDSEISQLSTITINSQLLQHYHYQLSTLNCCNRPQVVDWGLEHMQLKAYADELSHSYSGGNKRKLAAAIALVADPPVVLLDEPSAGMDPSTQQFMWNLILQLRRSRRTVVITSHSMEECEFLCTRIAIMVNGQFECIGSIQHLKERFGEGYTLTLKICSAEQVDIARKFIESHLPGAQLRSLHCTTLFYRIQQGEMALAKAFRVINQ